MSDDDNSDGNVRETKLYSSIRSTIETSTPSNNSCGSRSDSRNGSGNLDMSQLNITKQSYKLIH